MTTTPTKRPAIFGNDRIQGEKAIAQDPEFLGRLLDSIQLWGIQRGITPANGASALAQIAKLRKEIDELEAGLIAGDAHEIIDGIGDSLVVLVQIARLEEVTFDAALAQAWSDIKDRKGQMCCGLFVKEKDLKLPGLIEALNQCTTAKEVEDAIDFCKGMEINTNPHSYGN